MTFGMLEAQGRGDGQVQQDLLLYQALQGVCIWTLALVVRSVNSGQFTASSLSEFASQDAFCAMLFAKGAVCFQCWESELLNVPVPDDLSEVKHAVLGALLGLVNQDVAFLDSSKPWLGETGETNLDITALNQALSRHRTSIAAAAVECSLLDCLLAQPWHPAAGPFGTQR